MVDDFIPGYYVREMIHVEGDEYEPALWELVLTEDAVVELQKDRRIPIAEVQNQAKQLYEKFEIKYAGERIDLP